MAKNSYCQSFLPFDPIQTIYWKPRNRKNRFNPVCRFFTAGGSFQATETILATATTIWKPGFSKHDVDGSKIVISKCNSAFLQSFFNYSKSLRLKINYVLAILELNWNQHLGHQKTNIDTICSRRRHNCKSSHFTS